MSDFKAVRSLRVRYVAGLSALALLVTASWVSLQTVVAEQNNFARIINIAGHQGSHAERIALFSLSMATAETADDYAVYRSQLGRTVNAMQREHEILINGDPGEGLPKIMTPLLRTIYFDPASGLDAAVGRFQDHAKKIYETPFGELASNDASLVFVMQYGPHVIKSLFESAVDEYQAEGERAVQRLQDLEFGVWVAAIVALLLEAMLIFRPLEKRVEQTLMSLREKNEELTDTIEKMTTARLELRVSEERFRDMAENVPGVIFRLVERRDGNRFYEYVSPRALEFCGVPPEELRRDWRAMNLHPEDVDHFLASIREASEHSKDWAFEGRLQTPDGEEKWLRGISKSVAVGEDATAFNGVMIDITHQKELETRLRQLATTDPLTGALNRRSFLAKAEPEIKRAARHKRPLTALMLDIDHFKQVNDKHGHGGGDEALKRTVAAIQKELRSLDALGRYGGEEFAVLLPETNMDGAMAIAERIRHAIEALILEWEEKTFRITISIGAAKFVDGATIDDTLNAADRALYAAKTGGRNRVVSADTLEPAARAGGPPPTVH